MNTEIVEAIKAHAIAHYNDGGWDYVVECWDDAYIVEVMDGATNFKDALAKVAEVAGIIAEQEHEVRAAGGLFDHPEA